MKPQRYTGITIGGGKHVEGYPMPFGTDDIADTLCTRSKHGCWEVVKVDPATIEPVRLPVKHEHTLVGDYRCPACNVAFIDGMGKTAFCGACGQALQWPEDKEDV